MKRWALVTVLLYIVCLSVFAVPLFLFLSGEGNELLSGFYLYVVPVLILVQVVLLLVPVAVVHERPIKRRTIGASAIMGAIPMAAMEFGFLSCLILMIWGEDTSLDYIFGWPGLIFLAIAWIAWGVIFYRSYAGREPDSFISNMTRWLLRGSILELLVAVPSHIISRQRNECCAPPLTLVGIVTGLSVALMSFGPGLFFLFAKRIKDKKKKTT